MSDLAVTFAEIRECVGKTLGYGDTSTAWTAQQISDIRRAIRKGLRTHYNLSGHDWSFLKPIEEFDIPSGANEVALPARFNFLTGKIYFAAAENVSRPCIVESAPKVLARRQVDESTTGAPQYAAIDERSPTEQRGQKKWLVFWPTTDAIYTVRMQYSVAVDELTEDAPHPWGSVGHGETIKQACIAAAEQIGGAIGVETALYERLLKASIELDRKVKPQTLTEYSESGLWPPPTTVTYTPGV